MANWFHRFFNPHCEHCVTEREESRVCNSCDILKMENERLRIENAKLLDRILTPVVPHEPIPTTNDKVPIMPKTLPWNVRRQTLEAEDREKARLMKSAPQPITTEELEKEMGIVAEQRGEQ